jgi:hypothetical protein
VAGRLPGVLELNAVRPPVDWPRTTGRGVPDADARADPSLTASVLHHVLLHSSRQIRARVAALNAADPDVRRGVCETVQKAARLSQPDERRQLTIRSARLSKDRRMRRTVTDTLPTIIGG